MDTPMAKNLWNRTLTFMKYVRMSQVYVQNDRLISSYFQWIGLRENLQETIDFPIKYGAFL